jgi:predicted MFS family arabinose efflux permease
MQKRPLARLFPVLLLNLIAFAIAIPVLPALAKDLGGGPVDVTLLYAIQALGQFIMAPFWGAISDRFGRRPALLATFVGAAVFETMSAFSGELWILFVARLCVGLCAGNIATASALISDATDAESRSKGMAIIGISFGVGFTVGAGLGAGISTLEQPGPGLMGSGMPFAVAAGLYVVTAIIGFFVLLEPVTDRAARRENRVRLDLPLIKELLQRPAIRLMCGLFFFYTIAVTIMEATFFLYAEAVFGFQEKEVGLMFAGLGVLMAVVQGGVGRLSAVVGDRAMTGAGVVLLAVGLIISPLNEALWFLLVFLGVATIGRALVHPGSLSLTSNLSETPAETGKIMGFLQSSGSMARIVGPALGGLAFKHVAVEAPFIVAGSLLAIAGLAWWVFSQREDIQAALSGQHRGAQT